jgi:4a-hydroxytetrahydrobiopterin dehydratase
MEWNVVDGKLVNTFKFQSQTELVSFLLKVATFADEINHHPDCKIFKAFQLEITLFTYNQQKITKLDYQLANKIDELYK